MIIQPSKWMKINANISPEWLIQTDRCKSRVRQKTLLSLAPRSPPSTPFQSVCALHSSQRRAISLSPKPRDTRTALNRYCNTSLITKKQKLHCYRHSHYVRFFFGVVHCNWASGIFYSRWCNLTSWTNCTVTSLKRVIDEKMIFILFSDAIGNHEFIQSITEKHSEFEWTLKRK